MVIVKWCRGVRLTDRGVKFEKLWDKWIFVQFHSSMLQTNLTVMVWAMVGEMCRFVNTAGKRGYSFYFVPFCTKIDFLSSCIWLLKGGSTVYTYERLKLSFFWKWWVPIRLCAVSIRFWWSAETIGGIVLSRSPGFTDPYQIAAKLRLSCVCQFSGRLAGMRVAPRFEIWIILIVIIAKRTNKLNK